MKAFLLLIAFLIGTLPLTLPTTAQAREPFIGSYDGRCDRKADRGKPKKRKLKAQAVVEQNGPTNYDVLATVTASGNGEKMDIVLDLDSNNQGTLKINGVIIAGPEARIPRAKPKKIKIALKASGTAAFVGPLRQTLTMKGTSGGKPFTVSGVMDLDAKGGLILDFGVKFSKTSSLGKTASFAFRGARK